MPDVPALVSCAGNPAAVTIIQSLGARGVPIHALSNMEHAAGFYSRYTKARHLTPLGPGGTRRRNNGSEPEELLAYLLERCERGVLFPGTDSNTRFLSRHLPQLEAAGFRLCLAGEAVLRTVADKSDLARFAAERGYPIPKTVGVESRADLDRAASELAFPVVLKGVFIKNHRLVPRREELAAAYERFIQGFAGKTDRHAAVASEWIPGGDRDFAKLYVMSDAKSRVVAHETARRVRVHTRRDGSQGDTLVARTERIQPLMDRWLPFFREVGWTGCASMECKYDRRDGQWKLIEINPRPWAILKLSVDSGMDVPWLYYRLALGEDVPVQDDFEEGRYYIRIFWGNRDHPEPVATLGMLWFRRITVRQVLAVYAELLRNWRRVTVDVGRLRDPLPTIAGMWYFGVRHFRGWF